MLFAEHTSLECRIEKFCLLFFPGQIFDFLPAWLKAERMNGPLPGHNDAVTPQCDLRDDIGAIVVFRPHAGDLFVERQFLGDGLKRGERNGQAGFAAHLAHPAEFIPIALHVGSHFEDAVARATHGSADFDQLFRCRGGARHDFAIDIAVKHGAGR